MKTVSVTAWPYATQYGVINVPDEAAKDEESTKEWITDHWDEIDFSEPELDYAGTEFEIDTDVFAGQEE